MTVYMISGFHSAAGEDYEGTTPCWLVITEAENGGSKLLWNICTYLPINMVPYPKTVVH